MTKIREIINNNTQTINSTEVFGKVHKVLNPITIIHEDHFDKLEQELIEHIEDDIEFKARVYGKYSEEIEPFETRDHFADSE